MGVIPNPKIAFNFPISCISALIFPIVIKYFPKCERKGSFLKSHIKSLDGSIVHLVKSRSRVLLDGSWNIHYLSQLMTQ